jgi:DNA-binding transcriptional regulator GbsR (MarR family)
MSTNLNQAREHFIQGLSRISHFWGFPKAMGAIYGALYLSLDPLSLDDLVEQVGVSKGAVSTNARALERLGMVHKHVRIGERKDYYTAETDFWMIIKNILYEREKSEFDRALKTVSESLEMVTVRDIKTSDVEKQHFYNMRIKEMKDFFQTLDNLVAMILALDDLRIGNLKKMVNVSKK